CVAADVLMTVGSFFLVLMARGGRDGERWLSVSPFGGPAVLTAEAAGHGPTRLGDWTLAANLVEVAFAFIPELAGIALYRLGAALLLGLTLLTFDHCLGRVEERPRPSPRDATPPCRGSKPVEMEISSIVETAT